MCTYIETIKNNNILEKFKILRNKQEDIKKKQKKERKKRKKKKKKKTTKWKRRWMSWKNHKKNNIFLERMFIYL